MSRKRAVPSTFPLHTVAPTGARLTLFPPENVSLPNNRSGLDLWVDLLADLIVAEVRQEGRHA